MRNRSFFRRGGQKEVAEQALVYRSHSPELRHARMARAFFPLDQPLRLGLQAVRRLLDGKARRGARPGKEGGFYFGLGASSTHQPVSPPRRLAHTDQTLRPCWQLNTARPDRGRTSRSAVEVI